MTAEINVFSTVNEEADVMSPEDCSTGQRRQMIVYQLW